MVNTNYSVQSLLYILVLKGPYNTKAILYVIIVLILILHTMNR